MPRQTETERECCLTREVKPVSELVRFVLSPDGEIWPDIDAKAPGRGAWVTASEAKVNEAVRKNVFARSFKSRVKVPDTLALATRSRLEERFLGALGLARKAGQLVTGAQKTRSAIEAGTISALITATDAADDGRRKMIGLLRACDPDGRVPHFELLQSDQLGLALGQENVIHAALVTGSAAKAAISRANRLLAYRQDRRDEDGKKEDLDP